VVKTVKLKGSRDPSMRSQFSISLTTDYTVHLEPFCYALSPHPLVRSLQLVLKFDHSRRKKEQESCAIAKMTARCALYK